MALSAARFVEKKGSSSSGAEYRMCLNIGRCTNCASSDRWRRGARIMQSKFPSIVLSNDWLVFHQSIYNALESLLYISTINWAGRQAKNGRSDDVEDLCGRPNGQVELEVKLLHDPVVRVIVDCVVCLVENDEANISLEHYISMAKRIEKDLRRGDHYAVCSQHLPPQARVLPLIGLEGSRYEPYGDGNRCLNHGLLLLTQCHSWRHEPGDL